MGGSADEVGQAEGDAGVKQMAAKDLEKVCALQADSRSFDCASCDETAKGFAQDDNSISN
jgi:hypothetical protein